MRKKVRDMNSEEYMEYLYGISRERLARRVEAVGLYANRSHDELRRMLPRLKDPIKRDVVEKLLLVAAKVSTRERAYNAAPRRIKARRLL